MIYLYMRQYNFKVNTHRDMLLIDDLGCWWIHLTLQFILFHYHHGNGNHTYADTPVFLPLQAFTCGQHLNTSAVKSVHDHSVSVVSVALRADRLKCYCLVF